MRNWIFCTMPPCGILLNVSKQRVLLIITDGEQSKESFVTYPLQGLENLAPDGIPITFADGHIRHLPRLIGGPFHYRTSAEVYLKAAKRYAHVPLKQAVI